MLRLRRAASFFWIDALPVRGVAPCRGRDGLLARCLAAGLVEDRLYGQFLRGSRGLQSARTGIFLRAHESAAENLPITGDFFQSGASRSCDADLSNPTQPNPTQPCCPCSVLWLHPPVGCCARRGSDILNPSAMFLAPRCFRRSASGSCGTPARPRPRPRTGCAMVQTDGVG